MGCMVHGVHKELDTTEWPLLSLKNKWRNSEIWVGRLNIVKKFYYCLVTMSNLTLPKLFKLIPIKILIAFFGRNWQADYKIHTEMQKI